MESALYVIHTIVVSESEMSQLVRDYRARSLPCVRYVNLMLEQVFLILFFILNSTGLFAMCLKMKRCTFYSF